MKPLHIILIVCGGILLLLIAFIVMVRISNRRRFNRLQKNLTKLQQESEDIDNDKRISLEENSTIKVDNTEKGKKNNSPLVEDYQQDEVESIFEEEIEEDNSQIEETEELIDENLLKAERENQLRQKREEEFNDFMNEHSYSRKVLDKNLVKKIRNLPPEIKAIILNNVFEKFDDNK